MRMPCCIMFRRRITLLSEKIIKGQRNPRAWSKLTSWWRRCCCCLCEASEVPAAAEPRLQSQESIWDISVNSHHPFMLPGASTVLLLTVTIHIQFPRNDTLFFYYLLLETSCTSTCRWYKGKKKNTFTAFCYLWGHNRVIAQITVSQSYWSILWKLRLDCYLVK